MAAPYLTGNVTYLQMPGVTDVASIITQLQTTLLGLSPAWTNPMAGQFVSPMDGSGRQMTLQFNRISATNLEMVATDGSARSSTRRAQIAGGGTTINIYAGQFHLVLDWVNVSTPEGLYAIMLDESPELQTSHNMWLVMNGSRTTGDSNDGSWKFGNTFGVRSGGAFGFLDRAVLAPIFNNTSNNGTNGYLSRTQGGSNLWCPNIQTSDPGAPNVYVIMGRFYACLVTKVTFNAVNAEVSVPIDQANSAIFRVLNLPVWTPGVNALNDTLAVRKT